MKFLQVMIDLIFFQCYKKKGESVLCGTFYLDFHSIHEVSRLCTHEIPKTSPNDITKEDQDDVVQLFCP